MINMLNFLKYIFNNFIFWYIVLEITGMFFIYQITIKSEWKKLRVKSNVCFDDDTSFRYRKIWWIKNEIIIFLIIIFTVSLINAFLINEADFNSTLTFMQKIRNIAPAIMAYMSIIFVQKVSIKENSNENLDKLILLVLKMKNEMLARLVKSEIYYINMQNKKTIRKMFNAYMIEQSKESDIKEKQILNKFLYILLVHSACAEFEIKHKYEVKAFQSDSRKEDYLARVKSIRESLKGGKPFNDKEFNFFCTGILPEIGISYSDIYVKIKEISKYKSNIIENQVKKADQYFQENYINNYVANVELSNDSFDEEINNLIEEVDLCTVTSNH